MLELNQFPNWVAPAAENMAIDAVLLREGAEAGACCWRLYDWTEPAWTFGYSQRWEWVTQQAENAELQIVRRMTGGGIVDHRHDLTYALTLPPDHFLYRVPPRDLYEGLHRVVAHALQCLGIPADLAPCPGPCAEKTNTAPGICFEMPEPFDVIHADSGIKLAGAALKRNRHGILAQGSLEVTRMPGLDPATFSRYFGYALSPWLGTGPSQLVDSLPDSYLSEEQARFASPEWNRRR